MKIEKLDIKNFKFFDEVEPLDFEGKNILLYGENGSGKSTIFWALYTFLQSSKKYDEKIKKYFTHSSEEEPNKSSLVNIYADDSNSKIELFVDEEIEGKLLISKDEITVKDSVLTKEALLTSDFINYKYLFRFFNFLHREEIDLFQLFEYELLHFLELNELWQDILELEKTKPRIRAEKDDYKTLVSKLQIFNEKLERVIGDINTPTNEYLSKFDYTDIKLILSIKLGKYKKQVFTNPKIKVELSILKDGEYKSIPRPQSYFNEAKLTAIALSVRFAITQIKLKTSPLKLLILDDLLISLDMSNRDKVLDILLTDNTIKEYQKIILTHDKAFFEVAKQKFNYVEKGKWKYFEMYVDINDETKIEKPYIKKSLNYFESAIKHFEEYDYPACANYLRKEVERIKKVVNQNEINGIPVDRSIHIVQRVVNSDDFMKFSNPITTDEACVGAIRGKLIGIKKNLDNAREPSVEINLKEINSLLKRILHPQSHDDTSKPLYKKELEEAIAIIENIRDEI